MASSPGAVSPLLLGLAVRRVDVNGIEIDVDDDESADRIEDDQLPGAIRR